MKVILHICDIKLIGMKWKQFKSSQVKNAKLNEIKTGEIKLISTILKWNDANAFLKHEVAARNLAGWQNIKTPVAEHFHF